VRQESERAEERNAAFQRQRDGAQDWMENQMERLRQAVHDAVVETSGEIKGRIHMAVEMAREPIEQRSREAQRQVEELAERKAREMTDRLAEFEKAMPPRLQAHLAEVMEKFQKDTDEVAQKSVHRCQDDLAETLDSMLHLVRGKRAGKTK
jgi:DNA anti-recombination protein RmuC